MYEISIRFVDTDIKPFNDKAICDPTFDNGFLTYISENNELRMFNTDCITFASIKPLDVKI
ncbi:MAG: hypothetical protein J6U54_05250 [Clostridiales bacterium]|nr:hypothetical protein [Clostridiales bacterium]